jgi:hypothetical protein
MARKPVVRMKDWAIYTRHDNLNGVALFLRGTAVNHPRHLEGEWPVRTSEVKRIYRTDSRYELRAETRNTVYVLEGRDMPWERPS